MNLDEFDRAIATDGFALLPSVIQAQTVKILRHELQVCLTICQKAQELAGIAEETAGSVHHLPAVSPVFANFLDDYPVLPYIARFFGGKPFILNSMGGNMNPPGGNYSSRVHRDVRSFWQDRIMINTLVTLDDTTEENGATWLMPGSQVIPDNPGDERFNAVAIQVTAPAGSVVLWDSRLWHRAGENRTDQPRRIITPIFTVPCHKPGFDYCAGIGKRTMAMMSENLRQILGWNARVPASLNDWYKKPGERCYRGDQG